MTIEETRPIHANVHSVEEIRKTLGDLEVVRQNFESRLPGGSIASPNTSAYILASADPSLANARVLADGAGVARNTSTVGQVALDLKNGFQVPFFAVAIPVSIP